LKEFEALAAEALGAMRDSAGGGSSTNEASVGSRRRFGRARRKRGRIVEETRRVEDAEAESGKHRKPRGGE